MHQKASPMDPGDGSSSLRPDAKIIHSGHFMISTLDVEGDEEDEIGVPISTDITVQLPRVPAFDFESASKTPSSSYNFQGLPHKIIDTSLAKLFRAMTLAYSGQLTSPKFKSFKGLKLNLKDKLRLNNIIWREWHMQYIKQQRPVVCSFTAVIDDVHQKPEAVVLEGKYWKRRLEIVCSEYKKWRVFFKEKMRPKTEIPKIAELLERVAEHDVFRLVNNQLFVDPPPQLTEEDLRMDFSDTLFSSLNQPFPFPNPREMGQLGNADFIQPGLIGLQPNLDDVTFMDTLDPLHDFLLDTPFSDTMFSSSSIYGSSTAGIFSQSSAFRSSATAELLFPLNGLLPSASYPSMASTTSTQGGASVASAGGSGASNDQGISSYVFYATDDLLAGYVPISGITPNAVSGGVRSVSTSVPTTLVNSTPSYGSSADESSIRRSSRQPVRCKVEESARPKGANNKPRTIAPAPRTAAPVVTTSSPGAPSTLSPTFTQHNSTATNSFLAQLLTTGNVLLTQPTSVSATASPVAPSSGRADSAVPPTTSATLSSYHPIRPAQGTVRNATSSVTPVATAVKLKPSKQQQPIVSAATPSSPNLPAITPTATLSPLPAPHQLSFNQSLHHYPVDTSAYAHADVSTFLDSSGGDNYKASGKSSPAKVENCSGGKDGRRASHISAEQKRRGHIKNGFDVLHTLIPALSQNPNTKISKAAMLQKTAEYCRKLKAERARVQEETDQLKGEIEVLNASISSCQSQLPATGAPVTRQRCDQMKEAFSRYVRERTLQNWKFYILSRIADPLFDSFNAMVSTASLDELFRTSLSWLEQHGSLPALRPVVLESLRHLSRSTSILSDPSCFPKQAVEAVTENQLKGSSR